MRVRDAEVAQLSEALVKIEGSLDIKHVEEIRTRLAGLLDRAGPTVVELSHVAAVDTAGIQLLLALRAEASSRGVAIEFRGHSQILLSGLELLGLHDLLPAASSHGV
jgi:anti-sigma B factor antagonist